jgi:hypothetical protein
VFRTYKISSRLSLLEFDLGFFRVIQGLSNTVIIGKISKHTKAHKGMHVKVKNEDV